ncbi:hypothetical protein AB1N83_004502 [Pleurotus pulmonarius]
MRDEDGPINITCRFRIARTKARRTRRTLEAGSRQSQQTTGTQKMVNRKPKGQYTLGHVCRERPHNRAGFMASAGTEPRGFDNTLGDGRTRNEVQGMGKLFERKKMKTKVLHTLRCTTNLCVGQRNRGHTTSGRSTRPQLPVRAHPRLPKLPEGCFTRPITSFSPLQFRRRLQLSRLLVGLALLALPRLIRRAYHLACQRRVL